VLLLLSVKSLPETKPAHTQVIAIGELAIKMLSDCGIIKNTLLVAAFNLMWFSYFSLAPFMFEAQGLSTLIFGMSGLLLGFGALFGLFFYILLGAGLGVVGLINHLGGVITLAAILSTVLSMSRARGE